MLFSNPDYILLYQAGLANVIRLDPNHDGANWRRVLQHAYRPCEDFARGLIEAGRTVEVKHCDKAGDAMSFVADWQDGCGDLWCESKRPPN